MFWTDKTTDAHPIWMSFSARCTLNFECVEIRFLRSIERLEIGNPNALILARLEDRDRIDVPRKICCQCQRQHYCRMECTIYLFAVEGLISVEGTVHIEL